MFTSLFQTPFTSALLLSSLTASAPIMNSRDTAELYIFANCINNSTQKAYAAIFWYYPDFLPDYPEPQETAIISNTSCVQYAGKTTKVVWDPFSLTAVIPKNATEATYGTLVSTNASASSFAGPMAVFKGTGEVFYMPETNVNCIWEYYQQDVSDHTLHKYPGTNILYSTKLRSKTGLASRIWSNLWLHECGTYFK